jgi:hypothetical protein
VIAWTTKVLFSVAFSDLFDPDADFPSFSRVIAQG